MRGFTNEKVKLNMVKLTMVGRVRDGVPLAQGIRYVNEETDDVLGYKQQAEFILKQISRGALSSPKMAIQMHHHSFIYLMENGVCYMTLCDSLYPRKLAIHYLQDLQREFSKFDDALLNSLVKPYSYPKFDNIISNIRKRYIDTRTQANLYKLNDNRGQIDLDMITCSFSEIFERRRKITDTMERSICNANSSSIWSYSFLKEIGLKWTPMVVTFGAVLVLLWASFLLFDISLAHHNQFVILYNNRKLFH
ncbi:25.3 kDa vesicle transport protein [Cucurbita pepo subsp. pepo]|uniref:25.3 kDa vesicle transport protein n=1 Tax=Cucurbita pepo subsp. pepo TaxID=3664 RepID=UPI000C9D7511|nr:25.3 kDa vesicle transport protein [Cucurbita pepo subsp. pepo]